MVQFYQQPTVPLHTEVDSSDLPVKIGPYRIEKLLTTGAVSKLYLGLHEEDRELAVLKVLSHDILKDPLRKKNLPQRRYDSQKSSTQQYCSILL